MLGSNCIKALNYMPLYWVKSSYAKAFSHISTDSTPYSGRWLLSRCVCVSWKGGLHRVKSTWRETQRALTSFSHPFPRENTTFQKKGEQPDHNDGQNENRIAQTNAIVLRWELKGPPRDVPRLIQGKNEKRSGGEKFYIFTKKPQTT